MRLMKMMDYDFKVAHYWQYNVSEIIAYRSCCCCIAVKGSDTMFLHHSPSSSSDASQFRQWVKLFCSMMTHCLNSDASDEDDGL